MTFPPPLRDRILWISVVVGGTNAENFRWDPAIKQLMRWSTRLQDSQTLESPLRVQAVFHVPGRFIRPDYQGLRTGSYLRSDNILVVQIALPELAPVDPMPYLLERLNDVIGVAESWAQRKSVRVPLAELRKLVSRLEKDKP
jgi:hypothetical protein